VRAPERAQALELAAGNILLGRIQGRLHRGELRLRTRHAFRGGLLEQ
jgi:hypothetical protein